MAKLRSIDELDAGATLCADIKESAPMAACKLLVADDEPREGAYSTRQRSLRCLARGLPARLRRRLYYGALNGPFPGASPRPRGLGPHAAAGVPAHRPGDPNWTPPQKPTRQGPKRTPEIHK